MFGSIGMLHGNVCNANTSIAMQTKLWNSRHWSLHVTGEGQTFREERVLTVTMQVIRSVRIPDGSTGKLYLGEILVGGENIVDVQPAGTADPRMPGFDAHGRIALPGFVDAHSHAESVLGDPTLERALLRQGLTAVITGQDGIAQAPANAACAKDIEDYFLPINGCSRMIPETETTIEDALQIYAQGARVNSAMLVPCGNLRAMVAGFSSRALTTEELGEVEELARKNLELGAVGLSLGLEYVPNAFSTQAELELFAELAAEYEVPLVAHIRGYEAQAANGLDEFIGLARSTSAAIHVSHLHGPAEIVLPPVEAALESGVDLTFDSYPYRRGNTTLAMLALPPEVQRRGPRGTQEALADSGVRSDLIRDHLPLLADLLSRVTVSSTKNPDWAWADGLSLSSVAARCGSGLNESVIELLRANDCSVGAVVEQPNANSVSDVREIANHRVHMGSTDGIYVGGHPHPRGWGGFARMLHRHVLEWGDWSWSEAASHLSTRAARRFGLGARGEVRPGATADFVLVDPKSLADQASYDRPTTLATGTADVFVAGQRVLSEGVIAGEASGRGITRTTRSCES